MITEASASNWSEAASKQSVSKRSADLEGFVAWVRTVPIEQLCNLLVDAHWKGHLEKSELQRFFILHQHGVDMRDRSPSAVQGLVKQLEKAVIAAEYVVRICEDDVKAGRDPSPVKKACHTGTLAQCYAAMAFVNGARKELERWKEKKLQTRNRRRP